MKEAARAADVFLEEGLLLRTVGRDGGRVQNLQERMTAGPGGDAVDIPLVVVVDARTASGSEILAGALVQLGRAVLVGSATYGKGSVQKLYPLGPDTDLKLTVAQYLLADDREIDGIGLVPDVVVGRIEFDAYGVQYPNWDEGRQQTSWDEIVPWVVADPLWHTGDGIDDLPLEVARRVVVSVNEPTRTAALDALGSVVSDLRIEEEGRLVAAMEQLGVNWSPAAASEALFVEADVRITAEPWEGRHDVVRLRAHVTNREGERLSRAMVRLSCATLDSWDGVVIPIGQVEAGQTVVGEVGLPLPAGIAPREDRVDVRLRVDDRPPLLVGSEILYAQSTAPPHVRITGRLVAEPSGVRRAEVTLINEANHPLHDLEVRFEWPGDLDVEIIDQAVRLPVVPARERVRADLSLIPGADAPEVLPMRVRVETSRFGRVARWPLDLPLDGSTVTLSAPRVSRMTDETSAVMGTWRMPVLVQDEGVLEYVVVYVNGKKIGWFAGGRGRLRVEPEVELIAGLNRIYIEAADDEGLVTRQLFEVRGEAVAAADAVEPEER